MSDGTACGVCGASDKARLCRPCADELERAIGDMTSLLHEVSMVATRQTLVYRSSKPQDHTDEAAEWDGEQQQIPAWLRSREGRIALPSMPLVVNLDATDLLYDAWDTLLGNACRAGADEISSRNVVAWLLTNINDIRYCAEAPEIFDEITYLHRRMTSAVDRSPSRLYAGPCQADGCDRDLYAWPNADEITCDGHRADGDGCGAVHTPSDRHAWLIATLDDALLPLDMLRHALPRLLPTLPVAPAATWRSWVFRRRILPHTVNNGVELFRGGDVIRLLTEFEPRQVSRRTA